MAGLQERVAAHAAVVVAFVDGAQAMAAQMESLIEENERLKLNLASLRKSNAAFAVINERLKLDVASLRKSNAALTVIEEKYASIKGKLAKALEQKVAPGAGELASASAAERREPVDLLAAAEKQVERNEMAPKEHAAQRSSPHTRAGEQVFNAPLQLIEVRLDRQALCEDARQEKADLTGEYTIDAYEHGSKRTAPSDMPAQSAPQPAMLRRKREALAFGAAYTRCTACAEFVRATGLASTAPCDECACQQCTAGGGGERFTFSPQQFSSVF
ncbi:hypothetical protein T492DRAFT_1145711 [Pavlovales sp. CCMP2436]|nr:hypothetical protein T492DRAFT_1145711 [Pavlovales sp. CCMP2436]